MVQLLAHGSDAKMLKGIAEGLELIAQHVSSLQEAIQVLSGEGHSGGLAAVSAIADEEAAKYLILLDAVRCPRRAQKRREQQLRRCNSHVEKGIYAYLVDMRPADLKELRRLIDHLRASHYLDGPNDVDWIFRNVIESRRERTLYVDYVASEDGAAWVPPASADDLVHPSGEPTAPVRLILALQRAGCSDPVALNTIAEVWRAFAPKPDTHWQEVRELNVRTLELLRERKMFEKSFTAADAAVITGTWTFPLHHEDLSKRAVSIEKLKTLQAEWGDGNAWNY